ncbi:MAG: uracil-DNA glycosylase [Oscillospiraceae bacterium]|nr:uracil-DNA glycosylase [Oscillospiraceae bacterium]
MSGDEGKVNCLQCVHFAVSWDPKHPRMCKLFGFKTAHMPSESVYRDSGRPCLGFSQKPQQKSRTSDT